MVGKSKQFTQSEKAKRGWYASIAFMLLVVALIVFLSYVHIVKENRDILIGIIGMLTGSISSMLAIASGRDPSEVEELKDKLASSNADREALIARLRDAQIQMQLLRAQNFELVSAVIEKLSVFVNGEPLKIRTEEDVELPEIVEAWIPTSNKTESEDGT
jgi:uncharacterized transporter YbjL